MRSLTVYFCFIYQIHLTTSFLIPHRNNHCCQVKSTNVKASTNTKQYPSIISIGSGNLSTNNDLSKLHLQSQSASESQSRSKLISHQMSKEGIAETETSRIITTQDEIDVYAKNVGVKLTFTTLGPVYRAVARADHDPEQILGYCEGFIRPGGKILHVDKLEVWKKALDRAKLENPEGFKSGGQVFGVSLLLGYTCMLHAKEKQCSIAEFLAIDDEGFQHKRLVRFFKRAGFRVVRYVGEDLKDVPDRLVWGGCGTLMNQEIDSLFERWSKILS